MLQGSDRLIPAETHYLRHVVAQQEWPSGTTLDDYLNRLGAVVLDHRSGVLVSRRRAEG